MPTVMTTTLRVIMTSSTSLSLKKIPITKFRTSKLQKL
ncbi:unnamed protein product [Oppiella nova]|uniref:Uncharacterized protein n=1 Tax=Oppiella nova TaxID=334625 RepID=A0A7R9MV28_9ACAR|nr:unnamed protein product [Oppiella nova]CAD7666568.1 unnamed protein product [Oppiella nova]CAG2183514.1 unnamed protein product [Oppiella nova]CAG2183532.1 unnamed protein product [Oppiella nova]